jgi:hypothetical protein
MPLLVLRKTASRSSATEILPFAGVGNCNHIWSNLFGKISLGDKTRQTGGR